MFPFLIFFSFLVYSSLVAVGYSKVLSPPWSCKDKLESTLSWGKNCADFDDKRYVGDVGNEVTLKKEQSDKCVMSISPQTMI